MFSYFNKDQDIQLRFHVVQQSLIYNTFSAIKRQFVYETEEYVCEEHLPLYIASIAKYKSIVGISIHPVPVQRTCACCEPQFPTQWDPDLPGFISLSTH